MPPGVAFERLSVGEQAMSAGVSRHWILTAGYKPVQMARPLLACESPERYTLPRPKSHAIVATWPENNDRRSSRSVPALRQSYNLTFRRISRDARETVDYPRNRGGPAADKVATDSGNLELRPCRR